MPRQAARSTSSSGCARKAFRLNQDRRCLSHSSGAAAEQGDVEPLDHWTRFYDPPPMPASNYTRIAAILSAFDSNNAPLRVSTIIRNLEISTSTGFGLVRAMKQVGLLERVDHGLVRLGPAARRFAFSPIESAYTREKNSEYIRLQTGGNPRASYGRIDPQISWNPMLAETVETNRYSRKAPYSIGFANASLGNPWRYALLSSMQYAIRLHGGEIASFQTRTADDQPDQQLRDIDDLLNVGIDALIVSAADAQDLALSRKLSDLVAGGFPVVAVDRRPAENESFVSFVTASDAHIGHLSALWLAEHIGEYGRVWILSGADRASPALRRQSAALKTFSKFPGISIEAAVFTGWTETGGRDAIRSLYAQFGSAPDGVWCDSGLQGVGSIQSFVDLEENVPPHTGGDLNKMYKLAIDRRVPFVALDYPAAMGARAVETLLDVLAGDPVTRRVETPIQAILPRGTETLSVKADQWAERHVRWDKGDDVVLSQGPSLGAYMAGQDRSSEHLPGLG